MKQNTNASDASSRIIEEAEKCGYKTPNADKVDEINVVVDDVRVHSTKFFDAEKVEEWLKNKWLKSPEDTEIVEYTRDGWLKVVAGLDWTAYIRLDDDRTS